MNINDYQERGPQNPFRLGSDAAEVRPTEIPMRIDRLSKELLNLEDAVRELLARLQSSVLRKEQAEPQTSSNDKPGNPATGLGEIIWAAERRVHGLTSTISSAIARLEI